MKRFITLFTLFFSLQLPAQDSTMNSLTKEMDSQGSSNEKVPVKIFDSD
jgi:hypothetical protein